MQRFGCMTRLPDCGRGARVPWAAQQQARYRNVAQHGSRTPRQSRWRDGPPLRHGATIYHYGMAGLAGLQADVLIRHDALDLSVHRVGQAAISAIDQGGHCRVLVP